VALSNLFGKYLARTAMGEEVAAGPMNSGLPRQFPFHAFRLTGMQAIVQWYRFLDRNEMRRERKNRRRHHSDVQIDS
jgi:hypothetical protein